MFRPGALMDAVTNPAERVSRNGLVLVRLRVPKGTRSVPMSDRLAVIVSLSPACALRGSLSTTVELSVLLDSSDLGSARQNFCPPNPVSQPLSIVRGSGSWLLKAPVQSANSPQEVQPGPAATNDARRCRQGVCAGQTTFPPEANDDRHLPALGGAVPLQRVGNPDETQRVMEQ